MRGFWTALAGGLGGLLIGLWLAGSPIYGSNSIELPILSERSSTEEALELIEDYYWREPQADQLEASSIEGMVDGLRKRYGDRFTHYFDPAELERFNEAIEGSFSGVGMSVGELTDAGLVVGRVFPRTPASRAGIEAGDLIVSVDGDPIAGDGVNSIVARIKGPAGSAVVLGVRDGGEGRTRRVELVREEIRVPVSQDRILERDGKRFGYVSLAGFSEGAGASLRRSLGRVVDRGADGIVIDLRRNGGGLLPEAISTSSLFAPRDRKVVSTRSRSEGSRVYRTVGGRMKLPELVVLIDRGTASAAEILAAVLRKYRGAPLVGTRSFGKGLFQQLIELDGGGALDLSIGEFLTAEGESLAGRGLSPDLSVRLDPGADRDTQLEAALGLLSREAPD